MGNSFSFNYGAHNVEFMDYEVLLRLHDEPLRPLLPVGQCIADSIQNEYGGEVDVRLNRSGDVDVSSRGTIAFDIAHISTENMKQLKALDKHKFDICLESLNLNGGQKRYMTVRNVIFNYQQAFGGGEVNVLPVSFTKKVSSPSDWDNVSGDLPQDHVDTTPTDLVVEEVVEFGGTDYEVVFKWKPAIVTQSNDTQEIWTRKLSDGSTEYGAWEMVEHSKPYTQTEGSTISDFVGIAAIQYAVRIKRIDDSLSRLSNIVTVESPI